MTTEITSTSINVNMDFDINLYQAAIKSTKHANFNMYLHDEDSVDVNMISFCLFHSLNFSSRLLSQKKMDFYAAKSPILSAIQSSSGQVAIESVAWHSWPSFGRIISRNFTKPLANPTWGTGIVFWIFTGQGIVLVSALWRGLVLNYPVSKAAECVQISGQKNS